MMAAPAGKWVTGYPAKPTRQRQGDGLKSRKRAMPRRAPTRALRALPSPACGGGFLGSDSSELPQARGELLAEQPLQRTPSPASGGGLRKGLQRLYDRDYSVSSVFSSVLSSVLS